EIVGRDGPMLAIRMADGSVLRAPADEADGSRTVRLGVRPEKLRVHAGSDAVVDDGQLALDGTILDASYIGVSTQYLVQTKDGHRLTVYAQNLETGGASEALADGHPVRLTWSPQHTFVIGAAGSDGVPTPSEEIIEGVTDV
ncbi:MAG: TOBE domain-containing protein, partial [Gammaproteobacteria bacterium]